MQKWKKEKQSTGCAQRPGQCSARQSLKIRRPRSAVPLPKTLAHIYISHSRERHRPLSIPTELLVKKKILWKKYNETQTKQKVCHNPDLSGPAIYKAYYPHESHCPELRVTGRSLACLKIRLRPIRGQSMKSCSEGYSNKFP